MAIKYQMHSVISEKDGIFRLMNMTTGAVVNKIWSEIYTWLMQDIKNNVVDGIAPYSLKHNCPDGYMNIWDFSVMFYRHHSELPQSCRDKIGENNTYFQYSSKSYRTYPSVIQRISEGKTVELKIDSVTKEISLGSSFVPVSPEVLQMLNELKGWGNNPLSISYRSKYFTELMTDLLGSQNQFMSEFFDFASKHGLSLNSKPCFSCTGSGVKFVVFDWVSDKSLDDISIYASIFTDRKYFERELRKNKGRFDKLVTLFRDFINYKGLTYLFEVECEPNNCIIHLKLKNRIVYLSNFDRSDYRF